MPTEKPRACILTGFGINCEYESAHALSLSGAACDFVHFNQLQQNGGTALEQYQIFFLPGGWSFADDIQAGRVLANKFKFGMKDALRKFVDEGKPVIGICNGFQTLVQLGALPGWPSAEELASPSGPKSWQQGQMTLMANKNGRFEDRWVSLRTEASACPYAQEMSLISMPVRHGEGQVALASPRTLERLEEGEQIVFRYAGPDGLKAMSYPDNPNGSADSIAGICNEAGNVMGMMPHPECHIAYTQTPHWTARPPKSAEQEKGVLSAISSLLGSKPKMVLDEGNCQPLFDGIVEHAKRF